MENANRKEMKKNNTKRILQKYNEKYKKVGVLPLYGIQGLTFGVKYINQRKT